MIRCADATISVYALVMMYIEERGNRRDVRMDKSRKYRRFRSDISPFVLSHTILILRFQVRQHLLSLRNVAIMSSIHPDHLIHRGIKLYRSVLSASKSCEVNEHSLGDWLVYMKDISISIEAGLLNSETRTALSAIMSNVSITTSTLLATDKEWQDELAILSSDVQRLKIESCERKSHNA
jgi:hypothetical protein